MEKIMVFDGACISIMSLYLRKIYYPFVLIKIILISLPCQDCSSLKPFMLPYPTHAPRSQSILKSLKNVSLAVINLFRKNNKQKCFPDETCAFVAQKNASLGSIKTSEVWLLRKEASFLHKRNDICWHSMTAALWSNNISTHKIKTEPYFSFQTATVVLLHFRCGQRRSESKNNLTIESHSGHMCILLQQSKCFNSNQ